MAAEDEVAIGGFERIMGPNGEAQYYARNLAEAYRTLYEYYRYCYVQPGERHPRRFETEDPAIVPSASFAPSPRRRASTSIRWARSSTTRPTPGASAPSTCGP